MIPLNLQMIIYNVGEKMINHNLMKEMRWYKSKVSYLFFSTVLNNLASKLRVPWKHCACVCEQLIAPEDIVPAGGKLIGLFVRIRHLSFIDGLSCK